MADNSTLAGFTVETQCNAPNDYDGRIGLRISSIFVIGFGSLLGALLPVVAARTKRMHVPKLTFFIAKYFGSGVIIATAFIHLLAPAADALTNPCLTGPITEYDWAEGIALMTIFSMFFIELMASRFAIFGDIDHEDLEQADPSMDLFRNDRFMDDKQEESSVATSSSAVKEEAGHSGVMDTPNPLATPSQVPGLPDDVSYPPGGDDHMGHSRTHQETDAEHFAAQMTAIFILEFGVIFHSVFIGLTLAVAGSEFNVLYIVLVFHQTFEGLGLGSRLATTQWPKKKYWLPYALALAYGVTTPISIAVGLGVRESFSNNSNMTLLVNGVFDSISAGILIYTGLVELMAHEFMFNQEMRRGSLKMMLSAFGCMCLGAGLMALLGKWA